MQEFSNSGIQEFSNFSEQVQASAASAAHRRMSVSTPVVVSSDGAQGSPAVGSLSDAAVVSMWAASAAHIASVGGDLPLQMLT